MNAKSLSEAELANSIWEGVFSSFSEARGDLSAFDGEQWSISLTRRFKDHLAALGTNTTVPNLAKTVENPLPLIISMIAGCNAQPTTILDFGGGVGLTYFETRAVLPPEVGLNWHIIERPTVCRLGRGLCTEFSEVNFHDSIAACSEADVKPQIVHIGSALQYLEDWRGGLAELTTFNPEYLSLMDVLAGDVPTFVTHQRYYGERIPVWFWNFDEFESSVSMLGYRLEYRAQYVAKIAGSDGALPMKALPMDHRLAHACNLLFRRRVSHT